MFQPGDERVASLFLWHFVEEMEHRSSALIVYKAIQPSHYYRLRALPGVVSHIGEIISVIASGFEAHVSKEASGDYGHLLPEGFSYRAIHDSLAAARRVNNDAYQPIRASPDANSCQ